MIQARILNNQPWRFEEGATVYVRGWPVDSAVKVIAQRQSPGFPHYLAVDLDGNTWRLPQIHLSSIPIRERD